MKITEPRLVTYAQNREDLILNGFFKDIKKGFYVDVGASHPVVSSVTRLFYEKGWSGLNIEPNKKQWKLLEKDRTRDINCNVGISDKKGRLVFREYEGYGLSTFSKEMIKEHSREKNKLTENFDEYEVEVTTLSDLFKQHKVKEINFLKVDIEGLEYEALAGNDWNEFRPEVICIESTHIFKDWRPLLAKKGYTLVFNDGLNDYYVANEAKKRAKDFSYSESVLLGNPPISLYWHQYLGRMEKLLSRTETELRKERQNAEETRRELAHVSSELHVQLKTRNLVKKFFRNLDANIIGSIEKLNEPKVKSARAGVDLPSDIMSLRSKEEIAKKVLLNDLQNFYSNKSSAGYKKNYSYTIVNKIYFSIRGFAKFILLGLWKLLRKVFR